jgi:Leucine-rich repeat (LRR) protein
VTKAASGNLAMTNRLPLLLLVAICLSGCGGSSDTQKAALVGWAIGQGGIVHLEGQTLEVKKLTDLPSGDFEVARIDLTNSNVTDAALENLTVVEELQSLTLHGTKISNEGLNHLVALKSLKELDLSNTNINDEGLKLLANIKTLEKLHLHTTAVTNNGLKDFRAAVPDCEVFPATK